MIEQNGFVFGSYYGEVGAARHQQHAAADIPVPSVTYILCGNSNTPHLLQTGNRAAVAPKRMHHGKMINLHKVLHKVYAGTSMRFTFTSFVCSTKPEISHV
jgi:hypothetical protein